MPSSKLMISLCFCHLPILPNCWLTNGFCLCHGTLHHCLVFFSSFPSSFPHPFFHARHPLSRVSALSSCSFPSSLPCLVSLPSPPALSSLPCGVCLLCAYSRLALDDAIRHKQLNISRFSPRVAGENDFLQTVINKVIAAKEVNHKGQGTVTWSKQGFSIALCILLRCVISPI